MDDAYGCKDGYTGAWAETLQDDAFPDWHAPATRGDRIAAMGLEDVIERYVDGDDTVLEVGCSYGLTTADVRARSDADVIGLDLYGVLQDGHDHGASPIGEDGAYIGGLVPALPIADGAVNGVLALNSLTHLARHIGRDAAAADGYVSDADALATDAARGFVHDALTDLARVTDTGGYAILAEQSDQHHLALRRTEDPSWSVDAYDAAPGRDDDRTGPALHRRYAPWVRDPLVGWD